jgi:hypothetical protein
LSGGGNAGAKASEHGASVLPGKDACGNPNKPPEHHEIPIASKIFFAVIVGLLIGQILKQLAPIIKLPYTPLLTIAGLLIGIIPNIRDSDLMNVV